MLLFLFYRYCHRNWNGRRIPKLALWKMPNTRRAAVMLKYANAFPFYTCFTRVKFTVPLIVRYFIYLKIILFNLFLNSRHKFSAIFFPDGYFLPITRRQTFYRHKSIRLSLSLLNIKSDWFVKKSLSRPNKALSEKDKMVITLRAFKSVIMPLLKPLGCVWL